MSGRVSIRSLQSGDTTEVEWVAQHMRETMIEVLGQSRYSMEWLRQRVLQHIVELDGQCWVAEAQGYVGHTMVRPDWDLGRRVGIFSTFYVRPEWRRQGVARLLLSTGEAWFAARNLDELVTYTDHANQPLQRFLQGQGYRLEPAQNDFVRLSRLLSLNA